MFQTYHIDIKLVQTSEGGLHGVPETEDEADGREGPLPARQRLQVLVHLRVHCGRHLGSQVGWESGQRSRERSVSATVCKWWKEAKVKASSLVSEG